MRIPEYTNFEAYYRETITDFCVSCQLSSYYMSTDKKKMHYLSWVNPDAKANVLILHGFTESARKFDEMAYYFFKEGYSVYAPDLRGHGLSYKDKAPEHGVHISDFDEYANDVKKFINDIIPDGLPLYCYSHSLGGNVALLTLMNYQRIHIEKLVLSSPMVCGNMGMLVTVAGRLAKAMVSVGRGTAPVPGKCVFHPDETNTDAADSGRGDAYLKFKAKNRDYQTCGPDFEWVLRSIEARDKILTESNIRKLKSSILVIKPEKDAQLLEKPQDEFVELCRKNGIDIKNGKISGTCHEIYQSRDAELEKYLDMIFNFLK